MAGPILRVPMASGKFHGVMKRQGPTGLRMVSSRVPPAGAVHPAAVDAHRLLGEPAEELRAVGDLALAPPRRSCPSRGSSAAAKSSARSVISSNARRRISPRSRGGVAAHSPWTPAAASSAARASSARPSATSVSIEPSAGSSTGKRPPPAASTHCPAMNNALRWGSRRSRPLIRFASPTCRLVNSPDKPRFLYDSGRRRRRCWRPRAPGSLLTPCSEGPGFAFPPQAAVILATSLPAPCARRATGVGWEAVPARPDQGAPVADKVKDRRPAGQDLEASSPDQIRNVVLIGPGGSGKTTLVETLLASAGAIAARRLGARRHHGHATSRRPSRPTSARISLALAPLVHEGIKVNLIDTPGYADFVGELRAGLRAADCALFVVAANDGVDDDDPHPVARVRGGRDAARRGDHQARPGPCRLRGRARCRPRTPSATR